MKTLSLDLYLLSGFLGLLIVIFFNIKFTKIFWVVTSLLVVINFPFFLGYLYNFKQLIFNQIILFVFLIYCSSVFFQVLKNIHKVTLFVISFFFSIYFIFYFIFYFIVKGKIEHWTLETIQSSKYVNNYYYEIYIYKDLKNSNYYTPASLYKYSINGLLKKKMNARFEWYSDKGDNYSVYDDGIIIKTDSLFNSIEIDKLPKEKLSEFPSDKYVEILLRNKKNKN